MMINKVGFIYLLIDNLPGMQELSNILMKRPKLGLDYLRSSLSETNIDSELYDQQILKFNQKSLIKYILKDKIDLIGFYVCDKNIKSVLNYINFIKKNISLPVISGGPAAFIYSNELLKAGCDMVCLGEGELTIRDIVDYYNGRNQINIEDIRNIAFLKDNQTIFTLPRPLINNLDSLPFPYRDKKYIKEYNNHLLYTIKKPYISIIASRGCIFKCAFCTSYIFWKDKYRQRSVENVIDEIEVNVKQYHIKYFEFIDDIFAQSISWLENFCNILKKKKFDLKWSCILHPLSFKGYKEIAFSMMADAGCNAISFGAQSVNKRVLQNINRNQEEPEELRKSIHFTKLNNITTILTFIFALPGDDIETINENYQFCLDTKPHIVDFHPLDIYKSSIIDIKYKSTNFTKLTKEEVFKLSKQYMRKYYTNPEVSLQLLKDVFHKNPKWLLDFLVNIPFILKCYKS